MFLDLNVPWRANDPDLKKTIAILVDCGYNVIALTHTISGSVQPAHKSPIPPNPFPEYPKVRFLTRAHYTIASPSQLTALSHLRPHYDLVSVSPTTLPLLKTVCATAPSSDFPQIDLITLPLHTSLDFLLKPTYFAAALRNGIRFEVNYGPAILDIDARRNTIGNAGMIARCMRDPSNRGGVVISSGAVRSAAVRAPYDVINLAMFWGMNQDVGRQAVDREAKKVLSAADLRRRIARGEVIDEEEEKRKEREEEKMDVDKGIDGPIVALEGMEESEQSERGTKRKAEGDPDGQTEDEGKDPRRKIGKKVEPAPKKYSHRKHQQRAYKKQKQYERQAEKKARKKEQLGKGPTLPKKKKQAPTTS
ncbi:PHP domain-like protein [Ascobolus immersus RN42]|uniref:PHP domain-like protein n=1 Tax=Ascobolus immersus RN42 TaxID=1160509 RepID=A0A3N4IGG4_ASCIM|nr:PHP domain-like protein [Ascobolus immersus RN42]